MVKGKDLEKKSHWGMKTGEGKWFGAWGQGGGGQTSDSQLETLEPW